MKEQGRVTIYAPGSDKVQEFGTVQCVHCGGHFPIKPGSGKIRGFCMRCNGPICGPKCVKCVPEEAMLENMEAGRASDHQRNFVGQAGIGKSKTLIVDKNGNPF